MAKLYIETLLGENERILMTSRQHWFMLASAIFFEISAILLLFVLTIIVVLTRPEFAVLISVVGFLLILIPIGTMTRDILIWSNHQYLITNWRVMQIQGVINKNVTDSSLEKVNDVKMTQSALGRLFGYGDIEILTASELGVNKFRQIDNPIQFKSAMINAKADLESVQAVVVESQPNIPSLIAQLAELRRQEVITEEEYQAKKANLLSKL